MRQHLSPASAEQVTGVAYLTLPDYGIASGYAYALQLGGQPPQSVSIQRGEGRGPLEELRDQHLLGRFREGGAGLWVGIEHPVEGGSRQAQGQEIGRGRHRSLTFAAGLEQCDLPKHLPRPERRQWHGTLRPGSGDLGVACRDQVQPVARLSLSHHDGSGRVALLAQEAGQLLQRPFRQPSEGRHPLKQS